MINVRERLTYAGVAAGALLLWATTLPAQAAPAPAATSLAAAGYTCTHTNKPNGGFITECDPMAAPTPSPTQSPTPGPTSAPPSPSPTATQPGFPTATSVGVPAGWQPATTRGYWEITQPGTYTDIRVNGSIEVRVAGVTLRRVQVVGGVIQNVYAGRCYPFTIEDSSVVQGATWSNSGTANGAIGVGGYTARRVAIVDRTEGFRVGGRGDAGCGPTRIEDSYARAVPPRPCGDWHGDALQGYDAPPLTIINSTLVLAPTSGCGGSSAFFYGDAEDHGNAPITVRRLLVMGGNPVYRPDTPHDTQGLRVVAGSGQPLGTDERGNYVCLRATTWLDNAMSTVAGVATSPLNC